MLSDEKQWNELWDNGKFLTHHVNEQRKLSLYALHAFFVEVELNASTNKILGKGEFVSGHSLDKYAGSIDISTL